MNNWMTADPHFGHANIIKYCNRPFKDVHHMNATLIRKWNERVKPEDHTFVLGDFCFKNSSDRGEGQRTKAQEWAAQLNGSKTFVKGNHDGNNSLKTLIKSCEINYAGKDYWLVHRPEDANLKYEINFVGHVHERWKFRRYDRTILINVGVDVWDFYPHTIEEILNAYKFFMKNNKLEVYVPYVKELHD